MFFYNSKEVPWCSWTLVQDMWMVVEQNEERQIKALEIYNIDKWFIEKVSGKDMKRPELISMLDFAREGDNIYVHDLSRLARSTSDLLSIVETLNKKEINLISNKECIDTSTATGKLMLTMIGAINEFERQNLKEIVNKN